MTTNNLVNNVNDIVFWSQSQGTAASQGATLQGSTTNGFFNGYNYKEAIYVVSS